MKREDILTYVVIAAALYVGYKLIKFFEFFGPPNTTPPGSQNAPAPAGNKTYSDSFYADSADAIEQAIWGGFDIYEDDEAVGDILKMMFTDRDFWELKKAYGVRGEGIIIQKYYNLVQTLEEYLDADVAEEVNETWIERGMQSRV
jgi:hypothetical protein